MPMDLIGGHIGLGVDQRRTGRNPRWARRIRCAHRLLPQNAACVGKDHLYNPDNAGGF